MSAETPWWRLREPLLKIQGSNCADCGEKHFPPRSLCPDCHPGEYGSKPESEVARVADFRNNGQNKPSSGSEIVLQDKGGATLPEPSRN